MLATWQELILQVKVADKCPEFQVGPLDVTMCIKDQSISELEFYREKIEFSITKAENMKFKIFGKIAKFDMGFKIFSSPEWIRDEGTGSITVQDFNVTMQLVPESENGKLKLNFGNQPRFKPQNWVPVYLFLIRPKFGTQYMYFSIYFIHILVPNF